MSAALIPAPVSSAVVTMALAVVDTDKFADYLKRNLTSDLVLQILEECLLEENNQYGSTDLARALADLQEKDGGRYQMLKVLLEGFAIKEGQVLLDPKLVTASYKHRMKELELLKSLSPFRRFLRRLGHAIQGLLTEGSETEAIQEAIQITGEVHIAREELTALEFKKAQAARDADKILTDASSAQRRIIEGANKRATEQSEAIFKEAREAIAKERAEVPARHKELQMLTDAIAAKWQELRDIENGIDKVRASQGGGGGRTVAANGTYTMNDAGYSGYQGFSGISGYSGFSGFQGYSK